MTYFKISGWHGDQRVHLMWRDGVVVCDDPWLMRHITDFSGGPDQHKLRNVYDAFELCRMFLTWYPVERQYTVEHDVPPLPPLEPGAIE